MLISLFYIRIWKNVKNVAILLLDKKYDWQKRFHVEKSFMSRQVIIVSANSVKKITKYACEESSVEKIKKVGGGALGSISDTWNTTPVIKNKKIPGWLFLNIFRKTRYVGRLTFLFSAYFIFVFSSQSNYSVLLIYSNKQNI